MAKKTFTVTEMFSDIMELLEPQLLGTPDGCPTLLDKVEAILLPEGYEKFCSQADLNQLRAFTDEEKPLLQCAYQIDEGSFMYVEDKIRRLLAKQKILAV